MFSPCPDFPKENNTLYRQIQNHPQQCVKNYQLSFLMSWANQYSFHIQKKKHKKSQRIRYFKKTSQKVCRNCVLRTRQRKTHHLCHAGGHKERELEKRKGWVLNPRIHYPGVQKLPSHTNLPFHSQSFRCLKSA